MAAKQKKERVSKVTDEEKNILAELAKYSKVKEPTESQRSAAKELRKKLAPVRFVRLARQRVPRAVKAVLAIGKLTGSGYMHTEEQAKVILDALDKAVESVRGKLSGAEEPEQAFNL